ncbi:MAG: alpha/beta hydrolase [Hyphomonadaceae bacterium]|nr:alpha/beta hydrolase [Hyphomonadaceae bacterium]
MTRTAVVAHSLGCWAGALAISEGALVRLFVLIAPPGISAHARWRGVGERLGLAPEQADRAREAFWARLGPSRGREFADVLSSLSTPMLFVHSLDDKLTPLEHTRALYAACEDAAFFPVEGVNHRETARDAAVLAAIATFLEE